MDITHDSTLIEKAPTLPYMPIAETDTYGDRTPKLPVSTASIKISGKYKAAATNTKVTICETSYLIPSVPHTLTAASTHPNLCSLAVSNPEQLQHTLTQYQVSPQTLACLLAQHRRTVIKSSRLSDGLLQVLHHLFFISIQTATVSPSTQLTRSRHALTRRQLSFLNA